MLKRKLTKDMNAFQHSMYLKYGVRMVVLGGWINPAGKRKWSVYVHLPDIYLRLMNYL
jgi:hypothetical protein